MKNLFGINIFTLFWRACSLYMLAAFLITANSYADNQEPAIVVIAFPSTSENSISRSSLRAIFGMRLSKWPADTPVKVFVMKDDVPEHGAFSKNILQVFPHQLRLAWDRQVFSGQGQYPEQVVSPQEMLSKIASTPGAIGYIKTSEVTNNVRILQIR
ncbi:substrate-binding domain-containing protein [Candidatus Nitrotoga sp. AM1P]|uniref:substrate-binding domain-containing protein n=1 Tax=Candidatus Nitrotoga sp. AM1P TaxID=2559597 RepID=UPI001F5512BA|nr:substrate-binding domain-containing protein [Candidatus Nitrotoga sp. AM1P]